MVDIVEVRCPVGPRQLFTKVGLGQETVRMVQPQNWMEFSCHDCAGRTSRAQGRPVKVFHRYNFLGEHVETLVVSRQT